MGDGNALLSTSKRLDRGRVAVQQACMSRDDILFLRFPPARGRLKAGKPAPSSCDSQLRSPRELHRQGVLSVFISVPCTVVPSTPLDHLAPNMRVCEDTHQ